MTVITTPKAAPPKPVVKDDSMLKQKEMMAAHYDRLTSAPQTGEKVCSTFVPGNLNELIRDLDGRLTWQPVRDGALLSEADADAFIERQVDYDPDLWVIEIEMRPGDDDVFQGPVV